jgi:flagellar basal body-associated protein FliL
MRRMTNRETRKENRAIMVFLIIIAILFIVAGYGYFSGAWDAQP